MDIFFVLEEKTNRREVFAAPESDEEVLKVHDIILTSEIIY